MKKRAVLPLLGAMILLILDSRCAAQSVRDSVNLCIQTLIPGLFPMFVISAMLVPHLSGIRIPGLARLLRVPEGSEGILILGCAGGFPVGAACIVQAVQSGGLGKSDAQRMLGICSFCGPAFLFGIIAPLFSIREAGLLFVIQLETALMIAAFRSSPSAGGVPARQMPTVSLGEALKRATASLTCVCGWVLLASIVAGFLRRWLCPLLPQAAGAAMTGILELTGGVFSLESVPSGELRFVLCALFVCFGGISVLMQIGGLAASASIPVGECIGQKVLQGILGAVLAAGVVSFGPVFLAAGLILPAGKIAVEISGRMVYNGPRKEGI